MAENSKIEWTDYTFNPWTGCTAVSPACDHCYAEGWAKRSGHVEWGPHAARRRTSPANWLLPLKWNMQAAKDGARRKVFCASLADVFDSHRSIEGRWRADLWDLIAATPHLDWLLLTKRPQNIARFLPTNWLQSPASNIWLGTTVENQTEADRRIPHLLSTPAQVRFLSCEPLLGPVYLQRDIGGTLWIGGQRGCSGTHQHGGRAGDVRHGVLHETDPRHPHHHHDERCRRGIDWVICGGESGPGARPMAEEWARSLRDQCRSAGVPFFMKQMGGAKKPHLPIPDDLMIREAPNA